MSLEIHLWRAAFYNSYLRKKNWTTNTRENYICRAKKASVSHKSKLDGSRV